MKAIYDDRTDTLFVRFADEPMVESKEVSADVIFDYDAEGRIVGFELLDASNRVSRSADLDDDPFAEFTEWGGDVDRNAYEKLSMRLPRSAKSPIDYNALIKNTMKRFPNIRAYLAK
jgi:uncharacterized protein YuzE